MIGVFIGHEIGGAHPHSNVMTGVGSAAGVASVLGVGGATAGAAGSSAGVASVLGVGSSTLSTARPIVDTVTYMQKPVDYALAGDQKFKVGRGGMTKPMFNKIFGE